MVNSGDQGSSGGLATGLFRRSRDSGFNIDIEAVLIIVIGLTLGLVDQQVSEVPGTLRFPALIAALILVGQGINQLGARRAEPVGASESASDGGSSVNRGVDPDDDDSGNSTGARLVLILAIWLGIASLVYPSGSFLTLLSLLAAFLLFARGWKTVNSTRD